ncbi:MAG TPA: DUF1501 domain-containing protein [Planctomycetaceae bacterium]|nr:DUF1501 domain-containing protein [Planctomycetaceae bacterium]
MIRVLGSATRLCDGLTRRDAFHIGGLGAFGVSLGDILRLQSAQAAPQGAARTFGKAKSCILLFPYGSPPQHETFDPKPEAPAEIQGEMKAIATAAPGISICDHLPRMAAVMDKVTVVRSVTHPYPLHCLAYTTTGIPDYDVSLELRPRDTRHWPYIGSVVDFIGRRRAPEAISEMPQNIGLPWLLNSKSDIPPLAGPYAAFLGQAYDPFWPEFIGKGTKIGPKLSDAQKKDVIDPYAGLMSEGRFVVSDAARLSDDLTLDRLNRRRLLLEQFDDVRDRLDRGGRTQPYDRHQQTAFSLLTSSRLHRALDIAREPAAVRERYGMTLFGQSCLAARRLVEAGSKFVTVFWDAYEIFAGCAWDTHANHYPRLKEYLLPGMDLAFPALLADLDERGMLDETLVLWISEHGRTPQIDSKPKGAGRHHWSRAYSVALAGGGAARGKVVGSTDPTGGEVADTPVSPKDILATAFHLLGIDPHTTTPNLEGRPVPIAGDGVVRPEFF